MKERIVIEPFDPNWSVHYEALRTKLLMALGDVAIGIEHIGSTAIPDMPAKPIIDIDVIIESAADLPAAIARLSGIGYLYEGDLGIVGRYAFKAPASDPAHHLYVCAKNDPELQRHLMFRNYLRKHPELARSYGELKRRAAQQAGSDRVAYADAKRFFVEGILCKAQSGD